MGGILLSDLFAGIGCHVARSAIHVVLRAVPAGKFVRPPLVRGFRFGCSPAAARDGVTRRSDASVSALDLAFTQSIPRGLVRALPSTARSAASYAHGRVALVGAVHEALPTLQALLQDTRVEVAALVTPPPNSRMAGAVDLASVARERGVPVFEGLDLKSEHGVSTLADCALDLLVVVGWTRLVPAPVLALPRFGCVGFHASLLPRHRGRAPVNWAIIRGERRTGATMLMLDPGVDTGPIIDQRPIDIGFYDTCGTVYERVAAAGVEMLTSHLPAILEGRATRRPQGAGSGSHGDTLPKRTPAMGITDWTRPAVEIHNWIRGLTHPYPGAFSSFGGGVVRLWRAEPGNVRRGAASVPPGTVLGRDDAAVLVAAGRGTIRLLVVEEDGKEMSAPEWYERRGRPAGSAFDPVDAATSRWARGLGPAPESLAGSPLVSTVAG
jgi:methionyl-tRNA formyltransferase